MRKEKLAQNLSSKQISQKKAIDKFERNNIENLKPQINWENETKEYFLLVVNDLNKWGILSPADKMQLYSAFEIFNYAQKYKKKIDIAEEDEKDGYIKKYTFLLEKTFALLKGFFVSPAQRMSSILELTESRENVNKNNSALDLLNLEK